MLCYAIYMWMFAKQNGHRRARAYVQCMCEWQGNHAMICYAIERARESASALPLQAEEWQGKNFSAKQNGHAMLCYNAMLSLFLSLCVSLSQ
jgi:hypothetical protein